MAPPPGSPLPATPSWHDSRLLVSGPLRSLPPLPPSSAPPYLPCVEGRQRAAPHSSSFPPTTAPLQTLHMDVWGPARVSGQSRERYFLLVIDDYTRYSTRFGQDLPVLRLHRDRGGEFSSNLLRDFCRGEGILQSFTLADSPQQNGIAERRIGLVMEVARTSMIHAAAPHFLWPFAVQYGAHHLNLWPPVSLPKTSPTLRWTGKVGDASVFQVWVSRAFVHDPSMDKLTAHAIPYVFLGFVPDAPGVLPPYLAPCPPLSGHPLPPQGPAPSGVSHVDPPPGAVPGEVAADSGAARGTASEGAELKGVGPWGVEPRGTTSEGAESGGAEPQGAALSGGFAGASPRLSLQQLRKWFVQRARRRSGATRAGGAGVAAGAGVTGGTAATGPGGARTRGTRAAGTGGVGGARAGDPTESGATGVGSSGAGGTEAGGTGVGGTGAGGAGVGGTGAGGVGAGGAGAVGPCAAVRPRPYFIPLFQQSGGLTEHREPTSCPNSLVRTARRVPHSRPPPVPGTHPMTLRPSSVPLRVPLPAQPESSLPEVPDPDSDRASAASPTVSRLLATTVTDHSFESAAASALVPELLDFAAACCLDYNSALVAESASASPPSVGGECALCTDVLDDRPEDFESLAPAVPRFASMLLAPEGDPDAPDIPTPRSYAEVITGTYVDEVPPPEANIVDGMWIFRVKRPPGSPPAFKARYVAQGFTFLPSLHEEIWLRRPPGFTGSFPPGTQWSLQWPVYGLRQAPREWHDTLRTTFAALGFAPSTADPSLFLRTDTSLPPFYVLVYVDDLAFATADTEAPTLVKSELQKRHTYTDLGELRSHLGLQITRDRARRSITLAQSHMVHHVVQDPSL
ncbi:unnamed protein product [Closterium sp. NIES-54]